MKMFSDILGKKYGVNTFIDKSWRVNRIIKCGNIQIREIPTSGFKCFLGWGEDC